MKKLISIIILSIFSLGNAIYLTISALKYKSGIREKLFCDVNENLSCSELFSFDFTWFFGIPFSMLAIFVYIFIIILALTAIFRKYTKIFNFIMIIGICGIIFNSYIIYNEFQVGVFCLGCLFCSVSILTITILSSIGVFGKEKLVSNKEINE